MREILRVVFLMAFVFLFLVGRGQVIYTVAGNNKAADYIAATTSIMSGPMGVAVDGSGNVFVADYNENRIRKINTLGVILTAALTNSPMDVTFDASGNFYVADVANSCIKKVDAAGNISIIAGNGISGYSGDNGPAISAQLNTPVAIAVDKAGNIYIADQFNFCIRKVSTNGIITTIAGTGTFGFSGDGNLATKAKLSGVSGVAVDAQGNIYIGDTNNNRVRKILASGIITTIAGNGNGNFAGDGGAAVLCLLNGPTYIATDMAGNIYVSDHGNARIRKIDSLGIISTLAGNGYRYGAGGDGGKGFLAPIPYPAGVKTDSLGNVYLADYGNQRIRKVNSQGIISTIAGVGSSTFCGDGYIANLAKLSNPFSLLMTSRGILYINDAGNNRIRAMDKNGIITTVAGNGINGFSGDGGLATLASLSNASDMVEDASGNIYITDTYNNRIRKIDLVGNISTIAGTGTSGFTGDGGLAVNAQLNQPAGMGIDGKGNIYVADVSNYRIRKIDNAGIITTIAGNGVGGYSGDGGLALNAKFSYIIGLAVNSAGEIYFSDSYNFRIRKINTSNIITTIAGDGYNGYDGDRWLATEAELSYPGKLSLDIFGNLYIVDGNDNGIRKVNTSGIITTFTGAGSSYDSDGGSATLARFRGTGIVTDVSGNVFISDIVHNTIRKICITAQPATTKTADSSNTTTIFDVNNTIALHNGCDAIANLTPNGNNPVLGPVNSQVWLDATQNIGYVKRHYQITPSVSPTTSTATVTLFFTQADFDDFNAVNSVKLPQNPTDAAGKANFKIEKRSGVSFDATGSPSSYNGTVVIIDPIDSNIVWNNTLARWEVSFNVTGFSGFFVKTSTTVLPVQWLSVNGQLNNSQLAEINWQVQEQNVAKYEVQKSSDGINFQTIGMLGSVGNGVHNYRFTENQPLNGKAIYRIKQTDIDARIDFSKAVYLGKDGKTMLYPNPAKATSTLFSGKELLGSQAFLYNLQGKMLQQITIQQNAQTINLSNFAKGVYMLKLANGQTIKIIKE